MSCNIASHKQIAFKIWLKVKSCFDGKKYTGLILLEQTRKMSSVKFVSALLRSQMCYTTSAPSIKDPINPVYSMCNITLFPYNSAMCVAKHRFLNVGNGLSLRESIDIYIE